MKYYTEIIFILLLVSHGAALFAGWKMGSQRDKYQPAKKIKSEPHNQIDDIDAERLDWR